MILCLTSCLSKEIDIDLPDYTPQIVVECYLEPGAPYNMLLTNSSSYFDPLNSSSPLDYFESLLVRNAEVLIIHENDTVKLEENIELDSLSGRLSNYSSEQIVPFEFENEFRLLITTQDGKIITASTMIPKMTSIDSVRFEFNEAATRATCFLYHNDDLQQTDYYRRNLSFEPIDTIGNQDYVVDDKLFDTELQVYGAFYEKEDKSSVLGDTMFYSLMHITEAYYLFYNSVATASAANQNPFAQPGTIKSNVFGDGQPVGIFTGYSRYRNYSVIKK